MLAKKPGNRYKLTSDNQGVNSRNRLISYNNWLLNRGRYYQKIGLFEFCKKLQNFIERKT